MDFLSAELAALATVVVIDLVLAGDNAVVVGMAAAGLPAHQRRRAVLVGIGAATVLRIVFALFATVLLTITGLLLAGGILLVWVSWKLWREIQAQGRERRRLDLALSDSHDAAADPGPTKTLRQAIVQIVVADVSMSLDNVLAVAGTARHHWEVLIIGLALSVALMGIAATFIARLLHRYYWISYVGLALIAFVALRMIYDGAFEVMHVLQADGSA